MTLDANARAPAEALRRARRVNLRRLLRPRHIVFVGGRTCVPAIEMARRVGFYGDIWVVHPKYETLAGQPVYPSIADLPEAPDAAFLNISKKNVFDVVEQLSRHGAGGAVCFAAGFSELGDAGRQQQTKLAAHAGALALIGPNSTGFLNYLDRVALWPVADHSPARLDEGIAILSSSGGVLFNYCVNQRSLNTGIMIGVGNQAVLDYSDYLHVLAAEAKVRAIGLIVEDLGDTVSFSRAAAEAVKLDKPVVVLKSGRSEIGARVAQTHSGALVADDDMVTATLKRVGAIRVGSLPELDETLKMLTATRRPQGRRVAVLTNSGGEKALAADAAVDTVLEFPAPSTAVAASLASQIPEFAVVSNPFDYNAYFAGAGPDVLGEDSPHLLTQCFRTMIMDDYDVAIMLAGFRTHPDGTVDEEGNTIRTWVDAVSDVEIAAVMASTLPEHMPTVYGKRLFDNGIAPLQGLHEAMRAVHHAILWEERRRAIGSRDVTTLALAELPLLKGEHYLEDESASKRALAAHGLTVPRGQVAAPARAVSAANEVGYPVAVKMMTPVVGHKAKVGGVALNLSNADEVATAVKTLSAAVSRNKIELESVLVEQMVTNPVLEFIAGIKFDPRFGHALIFGRGGSEVEVIDDVDMVLLPASEADIRQMVEATSVAAALSAQAFAALLKALVGIASLLEERRGRLVSLDVNPLIVTSSNEIVAVDALLEFVR